VTDTECTTLHSNTARHLPTMAIVSDPSFFECDAMLCVNECMFGEGSSGLVVKAIHSHL